MPVVLIVRNVEDLLEDPLDHKEGGKLYKIVKYYLSKKMQLI